MGIRWAGRIPAVRPVGPAAEVESTPPALFAVPRLRLGVAEVIRNLSRRR